MCNREHCVPTVKDLKYYFNYEICQEAGCSTKGLQ